MHELRPLRRERRSLQDRFLRLGGTMLRINSSLDLDTVLQEVVDSACALTGAGQGVIPTIDRSGRLVDYLTSGVSDEESRAKVAWPERPRLIEHLRDIQEPFHLADFPGYLESRGFHTRGRRDHGAPRPRLSPEPSRPHPGQPRRAGMRYRPDDCGHRCLDPKDPGPGAIRSTSSA